MRHTLTLTTGSERPGEVFGYCYCGGWSVDHLKSAADISSAYNVHLDEVRDESTEEPVR